MLLLKANQLSTELDSPPCYENVPGNHFDKYASRNPIVRSLMSGFMAALDDLVALAHPSRAYEVGCGEGLLSLHLSHRGVKVTGSDVDPDIIAKANRHFDTPVFSVQSIFDLQAGQITADLLLCCEVMEHLPDPKRALKVLRSQNATFYVLSVPREPLWRILNLVRGAYIKSLGNTPGHIQHWNKRAFCSLLSSDFEILAVRTPLPWTMVLAKKK